jgi:hypothetical protein
MYNLTRNNKNLIKGSDRVSTNSVFHKNPKPSNIQRNFNKSPSGVKNSVTPPAISQFLFELLKDKIDKKGIIFDPCCGTRNLLEPWEKNGYPTYGIDN